MKELTLEDYLLDSQSSLTKESYKYLIKNIKIKFYYNFGKTPEISNSSDLTSKIIGVFGGIYGALAHKLKDSRNKDNDNFIRTYITYVSSQGILDLIQNGNDEVKSLNFKKYYDVNFSINFNDSDQKTKSDVINHFYRELITLPSLNDIQQEISGYYSKVSDYCLEILDSPLASKFKEEFSELKVIGKNFVIEGLQNRIKFTSENQFMPKKNDYAKGLTEFVLDPVKKDDIVANKQAIKLISDVIPCLMHYKCNEQKNAFDGFDSYILFVGEPGTGKTMLARYAMTYAKSIADQHNLPLSLVNLNFEDRFQYGPIENIRKQFSKINQGNRIYIVFLDEIDKKIPSAQGFSNEGYRNDVIGEFLKFRGGGDYINKGNYILIATSNTPDQIHPAILDVFNVVEVQGPKTIKEKTDVLYKNLYEGINSGYVKINDWNKIGELLGKYDLRARSIVNIAENSKRKKRAIAPEINYNLSLFEEYKLIQEIVSEVGNGYVSRDEDIIDSIIKESKKQSKVKNYVLN